MKRQKKNLLNKKLIAAVEQGDTKALEEALLSKKRLLEKCPLGFSLKELIRLLGKKMLPMPQEFLLQDVNHKFAQNTSLEQFETFFSFSFIPTIQFASYQALKNAVSLCPWSYRKSAFYQEERELGRLYREELFFPAAFPFSVRFIDQLIGFGLFAEKRFAKDSFIGTYAGSFLPLADAKNTAYCFQYPVRWTSLTTYCVDAEKTGNLSRFINHSTAPNVFARPLILNGIIFTALFALHSIEEGEEVLLNYGADYWKRRVRTYY